MIHVLATIEVVPGRREAFLEEFRRIVPLVRAEQGCLEYGPAVDLATDIAAQAPLRDDVVVIVERWASLEALKNHLSAAHMVEYRQRVRPLVVRTTLHVLQPV
jgi:quinol monooxygenase YgiN